MPDLMDGLDLLIAQVRQDADAKIKVLEKTKTTLGGEPPAERRRPGRPPKAAKATATKKAAKPKRRRKRPGGTRREQAEKMVQETPGISAGDVAKGLKLKPNYMYRVLGELEKDGRVKKDGNSYYPQPQVAA